MRKEEIRCFMIDIVMELNGNLFVLIVQLILFISMNMAAPLKRSEISTFSTKSKNIRVATTIPVDEDSQNEERAAEFDQNQPVQNQDGDRRAGGLGPWAIGGIVLAGVAAVAAIIVVMVVIDRKRHRTDVDDIEEQSVKYVDDDSWRGPQPFYEQVHDIPMHLLLDRDDATLSKEESSEDEDEPTVLELLK